ncbi:hypothetical protein TNCV_364981 [Trichonephila clavipes]|nr:hypothetical protein TNCV_364981 [Trichonephila clavipes]
MHKLCRRRQAKEISSETNVCTLRSLELKFRSPELTFQMHSLLMLLTNRIHLIGRPPRQVNQDIREPILGNPSVRWEIRPCRLPVPGLFFLSSQIKPVRTASTHRSES